MGKALRVLAFFALLGSANLHSQSIYSNSGLGRDIQDLFTSVGELLPFNLFPVPQTRAVAALEELAQRHPQLGEEVEQIKQAMDYRDGNNGFIELRSAVQYRFGGLETLVDGADYNAIDVQHYYLGQPDLSNVFIGANIFDGFGADVRIDFRREYLGKAYSPTNVPPFGAQENNPVALDNYQMGIADLFYTNEHFTVAFGRSPVHFGLPGASPLIYSDKVPYMDRVSLSIPGSVVDFDYVLGTSVPAKSGGWLPDVDPNEGLDPSEDRYGMETDPHQTIVYTTYKRFGFNLGPVQLGLGEMQVYSRPNNAVYFTDFIPLIDWHATSIIPNNNALLLDARVALPFGAMVYGSLGLDDLSLGGVGIGDSAIPTIWAYTIGAQSVIDAGFSKIRLSMEHGQTHYLYGSFDGSYARLDPNPLARNIFRMKSDGGAILFPLTSPYGPGRSWFHFNSTIPLESISSEITLRGRIVYGNGDANLITTPYTANEDLLELSFEHSYLSLSYRYFLGPLALSLNPFVETTPVDSKAGIKFTAMVSLKGLI